MSITPRFLDELRSRVNLSEVIGQRVKVTRAGREYKACCPFHHEKTPSFTINDDKQFYHCFGCGAHGDVIKFVMEHDNIGFMDALEILAAQAGLQVPKPSPQEAQKAKKEKDLYELLEDATEYFQKHLLEPKNQDALRYLIERGISRETIAEFRIGFSPDDGQALRSYLIERGYKDADMIKAGILKKSTKGGPPYAFFRDRVMFPVPDRRGRIIAFGGRVLPDHLRPPRRSDFTPPKYINSSETPLFHKGRMLYGEPTARRAAAEGQPIILVEGYLDVISCAQAGIRGALAPMGTSVTEDQILSMWAMIPDFTKVPYLCFDGDNAGAKAARRICDRVLPLLEPGRSVNFIFMPDGEDPDSLIKGQGAAGFQKAMAQSVPLFDFLWNSYTQGRNLKTPELKAGVKAQLEDEVAKIAHKDVQSYYKSQLSRKISDFFFSRSDFGNGNRGGSWKNKPQAGRSGMIPVKPRSPYAQVKTLFPKVLLAGVINHPHIFDDIEEILTGMVFANMRHEMLKQLLIGIIADDPDIEGDKLVEKIQNSGFTQEIRDICSESVYVHASFCSPAAAKESVQSKWLEYYSDGNAVGLEEEIHNGWMRAYLDSSEEDEERLRALLSMKVSDNDG